MNIPTDCITYTVSQYYSIQCFHQYFTNKRQLNEEQSHKIMDRFVELGGNFIDTANVYAFGKSEEIIGTWLQKQVFLKFNPLPHLHQHNHRLHHHQQQQQHHHHHHHHHCCVVVVVVIIIIIIIVIIIIIIIIIVVVVIIIILPTL